MLAPSLVMGVKPCMFLLQGFCLHMHSDWRRPINNEYNHVTMCLTRFMGFHTIQLIQWLMWLCQFLCCLVWVSRDDQPVVWPELEHLLGTPSKYAKSKPPTHLNHKWWCHWHFLNDPHVITHNITHVYSILLNTDAFAVCSWMIDWILGLLSELLWQCKPSLYL